MSVGTTLSEARIRAGLTVDDIAERTRIRRTLVENIEADDFHACGGDFYARGHVKSIAQALHLDPAPLLAEFDVDHHDPDLPTASGVLDPDHADGAQRAAQARRPNWSIAMAVALAAVLAVGAIQLIGGGGGGSADVAGGGARVEQSAAPSAPEGSPSGESDASSTPDGAATQDDPAQPSTAPTDAIAAVPQDGVTVVIAAVDGRSWVSATGRDTGQLFQSVMGTGQEQTLRDDRQVKLVIGNAGAVRLLVNGRDLGSPGGTGEVVRLAFGPGDPTLASG